MMTAAGGDWQSAWPCRMCRTREELRPGADVMSIRVVRSRVVDFRSRTEALETRVRVVKWRGE